MDNTSPTTIHPIDNILYHHQVPIDIINTTLLSQVSTLIYQQSDIVEIKSTLRQLSQTLAEISSKLSSYPPPPQYVFAAPLQSQPDSPIHPPSPTPFTSHLSKTQNPTSLIHGQVANNLINKTHFASPLSKIDNPTNHNYGIDISSTSILSKTAISNNIETFNPAITTPSKTILPAMAPLFPYLLTLPSQSRSATPPQIHVQSLQTSLSYIPSETQNQQLQFIPTNPTHFNQQQRQQPQTQQFQPAAPQILPTNPRAQLRQFPLSSAPPTLLSSVATGSMPRSSKLPLMSSEPKSALPLNLCSSPSTPAVILPGSPPPTALATLNPPPPSFSKSPLPSNPSLACPSGAIESQTLTQTPLQTSHLLPWPETLTLDSTNIDNSNSTSLHFWLAHCDALHYPENSTLEQIFKTQLNRDVARAFTLTSPLVTTPPRNASRPRGFSSQVVFGFAQGSGEYFTCLGVESPDTGSNLIWTPTSSVLEYLEMGYRNIISEMMSLRSSFYFPLQPSIRSPATESPTVYIFPPLQKLIHPQAKQFVELQSNHPILFAVTINIRNKLGRESKILIFDPGGTFNIKNIFNLEDKVDFEGMVMIRSIDAATEHHSNATQVHKEYKCSILAKKNIMSTIWISGINCTHSRSN